jgi:hypothetical protein
VGRGRIGVGVSSSEYLMHRHRARTNTKHGPSRSSSPSRAGWRAMEKSGRGCGRTRLSRGSVKSGKISSGVEVALIVSSSIDWGKRCPHFLARLRRGAGCGSGPGSRARVGFGPDGDVPSRQTVMNDRERRRVLGSIASVGGWLARSSASAVGSEGGRRVWFVRLCGGGRARASGAGRVASGGAAGLLRRL